jgi:hypothetical protein
MNNNQLEAKRHLRDWRVGALFMEAGTGKTHVAVNIVNETSNIKAVLYIAPLRTIKPLSKDITTVIDEVNKWGGFNCPVKYIGTESLQSSNRIYLEAIDFINTFKDVFLIVDESLKIKNIQAKRTKRIIELGKLVKNKLILNGTPITKNLLDLYPQMLFLSPLILNMSYNQYKNIFCDYIQVYKNGKMIREYIKGYDNVDYLFSLIKNYVFQCDLNLNVSQIFEDVPYNIDDESKQKYYDLKSKYLSIDFLLSRNDSIYMEMVTKMQHSYCITSGKFEALNKLFRRIEKGKTIIFCKYILSQIECKKMYPECMVLSYQREAFGLNLQNYCYTIFFDKIFDFGLIEQAKRRTFRMGQKENCFYFNLTGDVGLEALIDKNINRKISLIDYFKTVSIKQMEKDL